MHYKLEKVRSATDAVFRNKPPSRRMVCCVISDD
jgi:hypothetical protein